MKRIVVEIVSFLPENIRAKGANKEHETSVIRVQLGFRLDAIREASIEKTLNSVRHPLECEVIDTIEGTA